MKINLSNIQFKPQKGLTTREFILIALLLIAIESYFVITYILQPAYNNYVLAADELEKMENTLNELKQDFIRKSEMENEIVKIEDKLADIQEQLPPYVSQEEVIFFIEDISNRSGLNVQVIGFMDTEGLPFSVMTTDGITEDKDFAGMAPSPVIVKQEVSINFTGTYQQLYDFLKFVESNVRKVAMKTITVQKNTEGALNGVLNLLFTSYWDENQGQKQYEMSPMPTFGKASLFDEYSGYSATAREPVEVQRQTYKPDFYITINNYLNNSAKIFMMNYYNSGSEAIEDKNEIVNAQITLNETDGKYTYSYKLGTYNIVEDSPTEIKDGKIRMEVLVQPKESDQDRVGLILDVANNTSVPFEITVKGDNTSNPRFITGKTTGSVIVK